MSCFLLDGKDLNSHFQKEFGPKIHVPLFNSVILFCVVVKVLA